MQNSFFCNFCLVFFKLGKLQSYRLEFFAQGLHRQLSCFKNGFFSFLRNQWLFVQSMFSALLRKKKWQCASWKQWSSVPLAILIIELVHQLQDNGLWTIFTVDNDNLSSSPGDYIVKRSRKTVVFISNKSSNWIIFHKSCYPAFDFLKFLPGCCQHSSGFLDNSTKKPTRVFQVQRILSRGFRILIRKNSNSGDLPGYPGIISRYSLILSRTFQEFPGSFRIP